MSWFHKWKGINGWNLISEDNTYSVWHQYTINEHIIITESDEKVKLKPSPWLFTAGINKYFDECFKALLKYQALRRRLYSLVENALKRNLTPDNCWEYYDLALQYNNKDYITLSFVVREYFVDNFQDVLQSAQFLSETRRNPDRVYSILNDGISSISVETVRHSKMQINGLSPS